MSHLPSRMDTSNIYVFPTSPPSPESPKIRTSSHRRTRSRALSLLSIKSGSSGQYSPDLPKAEPTVLASVSFKKHLACGSFVPNTPATTVLRSFLPIRGRSRTMSIRYEKEPESPSSPSSLVPYITRTLPLSSDSRSPSPMRTLPAIRRARRPSRVRSRSEIQRRDIHPILATLEQQSKFCSQKTRCSTCNQIGSSFPQCGKCGDGWCSRECRLRGGKKHICASRMNTI